MDIQLTREQELRLGEIAEREGRSAGDLAAEAIDRFLEEEARFAEMVKEGAAAADRGEFVAPQEAWSRVERILKS